MKKKIIVVFLALIFTVIVGTASFAARATEEAKAKELTGEEIIKKAETINDPKDQKSKVRMILIDRRGKLSTREIIIWMKGDRKRLIKFLSPADVKGAGFLVIDADLPSEKMYLYLSALKKIRRIAAHAKGGKFMGSDFTFNDISSTGYSENYTVKKLEDEGDSYVLELLKKPESERDYDMLKMWVLKDKFVPKRVEYYEIVKKKKKKVKDLRKVMTRGKIERFTKEYKKFIKVYWIPLTIEMKDLKAKHSTRMEFYDVEIDTGLSDKLFTKRYLQKRTKK